MSAETVPTAPKPPQAPTSRPGTMTVAEYLEMERKSEIRHEYVDGYIRAMSGETPRHNRIAGNVYRAFENRFENQPCSAYIEGIRVRVTPTQYRYPDIVALCGEEQFDNDNPPALLNPSVLVEVLSPSTQEFDRREKFIEYRQIAEMTDYLLIGQDQILVIHYARQSPTQWMVREYAALTDSLTLASLDVTVTLGEIYRKVSFEAPAGGAEEKGQEAKTQ